MIRPEDHCPTCQRQITDTDPRGCEAPWGQRYCLTHLPTLYPVVVGDAESTEQHREWLARMYETRETLRTESVDLFPFTDWEPTGPENALNSRLCKTGRILGCDVFLEAIQVIIGSDRYGTIQDAAHPIFNRSLEAMWQLAVGPDNFQTVEIVPPGETEPRTYVLNMHPFYT